MAPLDDRDNWAARDWGVKPVVAGAEAGQVNWSCREGLESYPVGGFEWPGSKGALAAVWITVELSGHHQRD